MAKKWMAGDTTRRKRNRREELTLDDVLGQAITLSGAGHPDHYIDSKTARATFSTRKTEDGRTEPIIVRMRGRGFFCLAHSARERRLQRRRWKRAMRRRQRHHRPHEDPRNQ